METPSTIKIIGIKSPTMPEMYPVKVDIFSVVIVKNIFLIIYHSVCLSKTKKLRLKCNKPKVFR